MGGQAPGRPQAAAWGKIPKTPLRVSVTSTNIFPCDADMAQLVEHHLAKVGVAGSNPVVRSTNCQGRPDT